MEIEMKIHKYVHNFIRFWYRIFMKMPRSFILKKSNRRLINRSIPAIKTIQNIHDGQRCFIVGNGPSLTISDLEKLKGETSFGTHRIYEIYKWTSWRPTYYCAQDHALIVNSFHEINNKILSQKYIALVETLRYPQILDAMYFNLKKEEYSDGFPGFSDDISNKIVSGSTVTYMCLQIAVYMGFKEIILLGIDHNYSRMIDQNGNLVNQKSITDHFSDNDKSENIPRLDKSTLAYLAAKQYADSHRIKIYNATRGGKLEVFERVDFDSLF